MFYRGAAITSVPKSLISMLPPARLQPNLAVGNLTNCSATQRSKIQNALIYISQLTYIILQGHQSVVNSASIMSVEFSN